MNRRARVHCSNRFTAAAHLRQVQTRRYDATRIPQGELIVVGTGHPADDGVDICALVLDVVDVEATPTDAILADAHDQNAALIERGAVRPGSRPVDLEEDSVAVDRGTEYLCMKVRDAFKYYRPVSAYLVHALEGSGREEGLLAPVVLVEA